MENTLTLKKPQTELREVRKVKVGESYFRKVDGLRMRVDQIDFYSPWVKFIEWSNRYMFEALPMNEMVLVIIN